MARIRYGRGKAMIEMDDTMSAIVDRTLRQSHPAIVSRLESEAQTLYQSAHSQWPVKTGRSKAALDHGLRLPSPDQVESFVGVDPNSEAAQYAYYIKGKAQNGKSTWQELVRKPGLARARALADDLGSDLLSAASGKGR